MKLLLTSAGLSSSSVSHAFIQQLPKPASECKALVIAYAKNPQEEFYVEASRQELEQQGLKNITVANMHNSVDTANLPDFDLVYVCGGNTFAIMDKIRETGLDAFIKKQVRSGALYVGVSAGSIIAGPSIEIAGWGSEADTNDVGLRDLTGLQFTDIAAFPHFHEELRSEVDDFRKKASYKVIEVTDEQALIVHDSEFKLI